MRSECCEKGKTGRKQRGSVKLLVPSRRWGVYLACTIHFNRDEAGKVIYSRSSGRYTNFQNYFCGSAIVRTRAESFHVSEPAQAGSARSKTPKYAPVRG